MHAAPQSGWISYAVTAVVLAVVIALRWRRMSRPVPLKLERLWVLPAIYAVVIVATFATAPPIGFGWLFCALALVMGAALGWQRGRMMRIAVDPATHKLSQTGSPAALLFIVLLIVLRGGAREAAGGFLHLNAFAVTDMLMALALGLFAAQRTEMYLRARRLLDAARGTRG